MLKHENNQSFASAAELNAWLASHHLRTAELWVRIFKKDSGVPSVSWNDCVEVALAWGWIDGQKKSLDGQSYLQRLTPRRPHSNWSKRNCELAERLILEGKMQPAGKAQVSAAQADGRWDNAYAGSAQMTMPDDFLDALSKNTAAERTFKTLNRRQLFAVYLRLQTAKRPETRTRRMKLILEKLARGEADI